MTKSDVKTSPHMRALLSNGSDLGFLRFSSLTVIAAVVALGSLFFRFTWKYSVNVLFWDQWGFLTPFFRHTPGLGELFLEQWGPHREGIGLIADRALYPITAWNTRAESLLIASCIFLAMLLALALKCKLFGRLSYSDVAIPLIFLTLAQWETVVGTPNPAHSAFPLLMIMSYCLALQLKHRLLRHSCLLLLNIFLIYTGFGVFMGVVTLGIFGLELYRNMRGLTRESAILPLASFVIASASLASFFVHYVRWPAVGCFVFPYHPLISYVWFTGLMFWEFLGPAIHWRIGSAVGTLILVSVVILLVIQVRRLLMSKCPTEATLVGALLLSYSLLFAVNTGFGRVCLGLQAAEGSRYVTLLIPTFLAIYFYLLSITSGPVKICALTIFVFLLIPSAVTVRQGAHWSADGKRAWVACYWRTDNIGLCDDAVGFKIHPYPEDDDGLKEKLDYLKEHKLNLFAGYSAE